jgi:hypothetical protein
VVGGPAAFEAGGAEELFAADSGPVAHVELPPGATLPRGLVFGANDKVTGQLRGVLEPYGCDLEAADDLAAITELPSEELPPLLVVVAGKVGKPPFDLLEPVVNLAPAARRRTFVVLVAENLNTVDGSQAFFYQVNLVLSAKDLDNTASILYAALQEHRRLFAPLLAAFEAREEL